MVSLANGPLVIAKLLYVGRINGAYDGIKIISPGLKPSLYYLYVRGKKQNYFEPAEVLAYATHGL